MIESPLTPHQLARYSRQILLPQVGTAGQAKLLQARVLIIGVGGLGSPIGLYLAAAGIGTLGLADFDHIEEHNLQRQILHTHASIGRPKIESARDRLLELNPDLQIELHPEGIQPETAIDTFAKYDLVVDGTDNFSTRYLNNDAAYFARKPLIYGSIFRFEGQVSVFHPAGGAPCYRCLFPIPPAPGTVPNCAEAGVFGALCGLVGSAQAMETVKHILGQGDSLAGKILVIDALNMQFRRVSIKKDPNCPLCSPHATIRKIEAATYDVACEMKETHEFMSTTCPLEIDIHETKRLLEDGGTFLLDVREPFEVAICQIPGSRSIPMRNIPEEIDQLPKDTRILVYCHHGGRSQNVTTFLRENGYPQVSNVDGGIDAWAREYDPSMQRY